MPTICGAHALDLRRHLHRHLADPLDIRPHGTIPTELFQYTQLTICRGFSNQISGTVPTEMGRLTGLTDLYLYNNQISGTVPTEMGLLTQLS